MKCNARKLFTALLAGGMFLSLGTCAVTEAAEQVPDKIANTGAAKTTVQIPAKHVPSKTLAIRITKAPVLDYPDIEYTKVPMVNYAPGSEVGLQMDILRPMRENEKVPAVIFVAGGGFTTCNRFTYYQQRTRLAEEGYLVATINYRLVPNAMFPQPLEDVKTAIRYIRSHAAQYGVNPDKIAVMGDSAGGYLTAMTAATNGLKEFDKGDNLNVSSDIQCAVDVYGLSDLTRVGDDYEGTHRTAHASASATESLLVNGSTVSPGGVDGGILGNRERAAKANPMTYISAKTPPMLLFHGDNDQIVSPSQTDILFQALQAKGIKSERYVVPGANHADIYWYQDKFMDVVVDFLNKHLK